ncbi:MAG TPA: beta-ketoacyl-[acyl-carrier-protein] synthase family protein [Terriglobales bacterium]|nr:beta-ketoacyl-[acyl-carrier-protein] synthase family protein [Terriglobales bacterium]
MSAHGQGRPSAGRRRVVVTGIGAITPLGATVAETWAGLEQARCGIGPLTLFDASTFETRIGGEVKDFAVERVRAAAPPAIAEALDRKNAFGYVAACAAMADAGLKPGEGAYPPGRMGVALGTEGRRDSLLPELAQRKLRVAAPEQLEQRRAALAQVPAWEYLRYSPYGLAYALAAQFGAAGPATTISTACTSSSQAIGYALDKIRHGEADVMLAGGAECLMEPTMVAGFILLGALSKNNANPQGASRPFDRERDGFVLAEGGAMLVLEDSWHAYRRGARIYAELAGFGASINAYRITDSPPDGQGPWLAMRAALADAGITPEQVDYINAHGTSTVQNDASETVAIKRCFGERTRIPISSTKSMTGHMVNAAGAIEAIISTLVIKNGYIPPTINYQHPDPVCNLDYVPNQGRRQPVSTVVSNSFGFGGSNGSLVFRAYAP